MYNCTLNGTKNINFKNRVIFFKERKKSGPPYGRVSREKSIKEPRLQNPTPYVQHIYSQPPPPWWIKQDEPEWIQDLRKKVAQK